jgi:hypothetical protein
MNTQRVIYTGCSMEAVSRSSPMVYTLSYNSWSSFTHRDFFHTPVYHGACVCSVRKIVPYTEVLVSLVRFSQ